MLHRKESIWFRAGMVATRSGIYRVYHDAHRAPHEVTIEAEMVLPNCRRCGDRVHFAPLITVEPVQSERDLDFLDKAA